MSPAPSSNILVVDRNMQRLNELQLALKAAGYAVTATCLVDCAFYNVTTERFAAIVCAQNLYTDEDGYEFLHSLHTRGVAVLRFMMYIEMPWRKYDAERIGITCIRFELHQLQRSRLELFTALAPVMPRVCA